MVELKDLVGKHILDAVDFSNEQVKTWDDEFEDCGVVRFRLDGKVFVATEDPSDGYRSSMRDIALLGDVPMQNVFVPQAVVGRYQAERPACEGADYTNQTDILELVDEVTGRVVLEVGTDNTDDYYPSFVSSFHPEAMACNQGREVA